MKKTLLAVLMALSLAAGSTFAAASPSKPAILSKVLPTYPEACMQAGVEGRVIVEGLVNAKGEIIGVNAVKAPDPELADVLIINTCSFIDQAKKESVDAIFGAVEDRENSRPRQKIIVAGCLSQRFSKELPSLMPEGIVNKLKTIHIADNKPGRIATSVSQAVHFMLEISAVIKPGEGVVQAKVC